MELQCFCLEVQTVCPSLKFSIFKSQKNQCNFFFVFISATGQLKGQLTHHACVSGQNALSTHAVVSHFAKLTVAFLNL